MPSTVHHIDPLTDSRWDDLLERHTRAAVFHSRGWLEALKRTYGYEPVVLTTTEAGPLANGLALCRVSTLLARRLVSLPFSDHCDPLLGAPEDLSALLGFLAGEVGGRRWRSVELRPRPETWPAGENRDMGMAEGDSYYLHSLRLDRPLAQIFDGFHPTSTRRAVRRAEREGLNYESGTSEQLLSGFYRLLRITRRRHGLPPQPFVWFQNLAACMGRGLNVHVASKDGIPVAGMLTLSFKKTLVYKYGGSDSRYHSLGSVPFLFWRAIQGAIAEGTEEFDLGRSDLDQPGLVAFKDHLGATRTTLTYYTRPAGRTGSARVGPLRRLARNVVPHVPDAALDLAGRLLYRHLG